jgi:hypothetical protein
LKTGREAAALSRPVALAATDDKEPRIEEADATMELARVADAAELVDEPEATDDPEAEEVAGAVAVLAADAVEVALTEPLAEPEEAGK